MMKPNVKDFIAVSSGLANAISQAGRECVAGRQLRCTACGRVERPTPDDGISYIRSGWPKCCGYTMTLEDSPDARDPEA